MSTETLMASLCGRLQPYHDDLIAFAQKLLQTPSYPGQEGEAAALVQAQMNKLHYDRTWIDAAGNAIGLLRGQTSARSMMFNAHLDHVSVGDERGWPHPPFAGDIAGGELWGRGAVDLKGSIASMVYGVGALKSEGIVPPCDVYVAAVVYEEKGGLGTAVVLQQLRPEFCVIGEATQNKLALGHRGAIGVDVQFRGRAVHASLARTSANANYAAARFMLALRDMQHEHDDMLGPASAAPTLYTTDQTSQNVIPGLVHVYVDWRSVPGQTVQSVTTLLQTLVDASLEPGVSGAVSTREFPSRTYTGLERNLQVSLVAVKLDPSGVLARRSRRALENGLGRAVEQMVWQFCTDGSLYAVAGIPVVGFGPGDPELAHTSDERVALTQLTDAMCGDAALALSPALS